jgi:glycerophosphoryl diester phosphodiesterase
MINYCREKNIKLIPWTVNDLPTMQKLKDMGVDGVISDYPDLFAQLK